MTIWLFGDSFALMNWENTKDVRSWPELLSKKVKHKVNILGKGGTGLEYMFYKFNNYFDSFSCNDIIIVCFTSSIRNWYFFDQPQITHMNMVERILTNKDNWLKLTIEEAKAIELNETYLLNPQKLETFSEFFFRQLNYLAIEKNIKPIIMSYEPYIKEEWIKKYKDCYFASGYLMKACVEEFEDEQMAHRSVGDDVRAGHFSYRNHRIIANKLEEYILYGNKFNLNADLEKAFISEDNYKDHVFRVREFMQKFTFKENKV